VVNLVIRVLELQVKLQGLDKVGHLKGIPWSHFQLGQTAQHGINMLDLKVDSYIERALAHARRAGL
jgi:hypothetical protein